MLSDDGGRLYTRNYLLNWLKGDLFSPGIPVFNTGNRDVVVFVLVLFDAEFHVNPQSLPL